MAFRIAAAVVVQFQPDWTFLLRTDFLLVLVAIMTGKRMKDFGVAPAWGWIAVFLFSFVLPIGAMFLSPPSSTADPFSVVPYWVGLLTGGLLVVLIVVVGSKKGDAGANRYGDPPDRIEPAATAVNS